MTARVLPGLCLSCLDTEAWVILLLSLTQKHSSLHPSTQQASSLPHGDMGRGRSSLEPMTRMQI